MRDLHPAGSRRRDFDVLDTTARINAARADDLLQAAEDVGADVLADFMNQADAAARRHRQSLRLLTAARSRIAPLLTAARCGELEASRRAREALASERTRLAFARLRERLARREAHADAAD